MVGPRVLIIVPIVTTIGTIYRNYLGINEYPNLNILRNCSYKTISNKL